LLSIIVLGVFQLPPSGLRVDAQPAVSRDNGLNIKVVFVGVDEGVIDTTYQDWNNPSYKYQSVLIPGVSNGVLFNFNYTYAVADKEFNAEFAAYLNSIAATEVRFNVLWNFSYKLLHADYALNLSSFEISTENTFYDADGVVEWLAGHLDQVGGAPENGYVLFVADLHERVPSFTPDQFRQIMRKGDVVATPHYYNKTFHDVDLALRTNQRWMTSWGGNDRFYFIDISAGPSMVDQQLPVQLAASVNNISLDSPYGVKWFNQYVSDYVYGAVYNLFAPDFIYPINLAERYTIDILVLDNRTEGATPQVETTVDGDEIQKRLQDLLSFAQVEVEQRFARLQEYPELERVVLSSTTASRGPSSFPPASLYPPNVVDLRPVYQWLSESGEGHLKDLFTITRDAHEWDIPVIIFAFQGDFNLGSTYKEWLALEKTVPEDLWGISLYDLVLISHSEYDLRMGDYLISVPTQPGAGYGFTQTIIHEVGHMVGLNHPFINDPTENYVSSVMAYYPYPTSFSQFDKDVLLRGFGDDLIIKTEAAISRASSNPLLSAAVVDAARKLNEAKRQYARMDYESALRSAQEASSKLGLLRLELKIPGLYVTVFGALFIGVLGFVIGYFVYAKRFFKNKV